MEVGQTGVKPTTKQQPSRFERADLVSPVNQLLMELTMASNALAPLPPSEFDPMVRFSEAIYIALDCTGLELTKTENLVFCFQGQLVNLIQEVVLLL